MTTTKRLSRPEARRLTELERAVCGRKHVSRRRLAELVEFIQDLMRRGLVKPDARLLSVSAARAHNELDADALCDTIASLALTETSVVKACLMHVVMALAMHGIIAGHIQSQKLDRLPGRPHTDHHQVVSKLGSKPTIATRHSQVTTATVAASTQQQPFNNTATQYADLLQTISGLQPNTTIVSRVRNTVHKSGLAAVPVDSDAVFRQATAMMQHTFNLNSGVQACLMGYAQQRRIAQQHIEHVLLDNPGLTAQGDPIGLAPGSHIYVTGDVIWQNQNIVQHHGIYLGDGMVVDVGSIPAACTAAKATMAVTMGTRPHKAQGVGLTNLVDFTGDALRRPDKNRIVSVVQYREPDDARKILDRAVSVIGPKPYNVLTNNCEHLATWVATGKKVSPQVERVKGWAARAAVCLKLMAKVMPRSLFRGKNCRGSNNNSSSSGTLYYTLSNTVDEGEVASVEAFFDARSNKSNNKSTSFFTPKSR